MRRTPAEIAELRERIRILDSAGFKASADALRRKLPRKRAKVPPQRSRK
jgi:hypothetical protein